MYIYANHDEDNDYLEGTVATIAFERLEKVWKREINQAGPGKCDYVTIRLDVEEKNNIPQISMEIMYVVKAEEFSRLCREQIELMRKLTKSLNLPAETYIDIADRPTEAMKLMDIGGNRK